MATTTKTLTRDTWTDLGSTPCFIEAASTNVITYVIDTVAPSSVSDVGHKLGEAGRDRSVNISLTGQKVFARSISEFGSSVIVSR